MPEVLILILKIAGFVLLGIVGLVVVVLLLLVFCPIVYQGDFQKEEEFRYDATLNWLGGLLRIRAKQDRGESLLVMKWFWFFDIPKGEGIWALIKKIWNRFYPRIVFLYALLHDDEAYLTDQRVHNAVDLILRRVGKIILCIWPYDIHGTVEFGLSSPDKTGKLVAFLASVIPMHDAFQMTPNFSEEVFLGDATLKGRIFLYRIVHHALKVILNRDVRYAYRELQNRIQRLED